MNLSHKPGVSVTAETSKLEILVVEDSSIVRERLVRLLSAVPNASVIGEAATAADAIDKITDLAPDVVTVDLRLGDSSGVEVLRAVAAMRTRPRIAVVSNHGDEQSRRECLALGADFFFDKSHELGDLRAMMSRLAAARQRIPPWERGNPA